MPLTNYPNGVASYGAPITGGRFANPWSTHYFVDGTDGNDSQDGTSPDNAFATIQAAVTASTGGDVIYIRPKVYTVGTGFARYEEDVTISMSTAAGSGTDTLANKSLIGITQRGHPSDYLSVRWKYATATNLTIEAPGTHIENIGFFAEDSTYAINIVNNAQTTLGGAGTSIYNCAFKGDPGIYANGADELQIVNCRFQAKYDGTTSGIELVGSTNQVKRPLIMGCEFIGGNGNEMKTAPIVGAAPWHDAIIRDCYFANDVDSGIYINIAGSSSTGSIANCQFAVADISTTYIVEGGLIVTGAYDGGGLATAS